MKNSQLLMWIAAASPLLLLPAQSPAEDAKPQSALKATAGAFVVKPYLQIGRIPAPGTLQLLWHGPDADADWSVEQRAGTDGSWKETEAPVSRRVAVAGIAPHRVFRAALTGLEPGGAFQYRVLKGGEVVFNADARGPKTADQPFRYVIFGDIGAGTAEQKPLAQRAFLSKPDLVVIPGDIVYEYGLISEYHEKYWPVYNADKSSESGAPLLRSTPSVAAPGNHDTEVRNLDRHPDALAYYLSTARSVRKAARSSRR